MPGWAGQRKALFLDRDGTLIPDLGYPGDPAQVTLLPGIVPTLLEYQRQGYLLIVISNQSGIGRGMITHQQYRAVQERMLALLAGAGVKITASYYCPHAPETNCFCRKPRPGMLLLAAHDHEIDLASSLLIGDKVSDLEAGRAVGCRTLRCNAEGLIGCETNESKKCD